MVALDSGEVGGLLKRLIRVVICQGTLTSLDAVPPRCCSS